MENTLYRRPLPAETIAFSSEEGRRLFAEALAAGGLEGYFPLAEQFHTQSEPAFCALGSLVVALNALAIDPGRLWKGPWRWFAEDMLDCCVPLAQVRERGLDLDELACLARCNGASGAAQHADRATPEAWRAALLAAARAETVLIASYDRAELGQSGSGHFSPIGGYHAARDLVLLLDVARFKYPPHWVAADRLWQAMLTLDASAGKTRGWLSLTRRREGIALGFSVRCSGDNWHGFAARLSAALSALADAKTVGELALIISPLLAHLELRQPSAAPHRAALDATRAALRALPSHSEIVQAVGAERAEGVALLLLAVSDALSAEQRAALGELPDGPWRSELENLRTQLSAISNMRFVQPVAGAFGVGALEQGRE